MKKDIVKITIFQDRIDFENLGEHEVMNWGEQVLTEDGWKCYSSGYVPNEQEEICKYLMNQKRAFREQILYFQSLIDTIDLELVRQCRKGYEE